MSTETETERVLQAEVDEGFFTLGAQVSVRLGGERLVDLALGDAGTGAPLQLDTVFRVYCTIKPLTAVAVARQVDLGRLDLDEPVAARLPEVAAVADGAVTLRDILTHTAGLQRPMALELELVAPQRRRRALDRAARPPGWPVGRRAAYSEVFGWDLLGRLLEAVTGEPLDDHLRDSLLEPLGLDDTWIGMTDEEHAELLSRLGISFDLRTHRPMPMLYERSKAWCTEVNPAHGGYTTAADLATFYAAVLAQLGGAAHPALPSAEVLRTFTSPARPTLYDEVLGRECGYGLGFMTGLADHAFGRRCSASSFGHSGNVGSSFAFADPEWDVAAAVVLNGLVDHESAFLRRPAIVRAVYADVEAALAERDEADAPADADDGTRAAPAPRRRFGFRRSNA